MLSRTFLPLFAAAAAVSAQSTSAPVVQGNPVGAQYVAELPAPKAPWTVSGSVVAESSPDGKGVLFSIAFAALPAEGGPFLYHIHEKPVPANGNCTGTGAHLDPYKRGEDPPCDATKPETCQTGDLSGKHGKISAQSYSDKYTDLYLATKESDLSYFGNLSVVVHLANKTRISCANFTIKSPGAISSLPVSVGPSSGFAIPTGGYNDTLSMSATATGTGIISSSAGSPTGTVISPSISPAPSSPAQKLVAGAGAVVAAAAALML